MAVIFGLLAALGIGLSDLFGRRVVVASSAVTAAAAIQIFAGLSAVALAVAAASAFHLPSFGWGCASGVGMAGGLSLYYSGIHRSSSALVAPIVASLSALVPYVYAVVRGSGSSLVAVLGALVAVVGLVAVTGGAVSPERLAIGVRLGIGSGLSYAWATIAFIEAADAPGWWPVVGQRVVGAGLLLAVAVLAAQPLWPPPGQRINGVVSGVLTAAVSVSLLAGLAIDAAPATVALSTFPVFSVVVGRLFFADALRPIQVVGIALVVTGIAAVSVG